MAVSRVHSLGVIQPSLSLLTSADCWR